MIALKEKKKYKWCNFINLKSEPITTIPCSRDIIGYSQINLKRFLNMVREEPEACQMPNKIFFYIFSIKQTLTNFLYTVHLKI